MEEKPKVKKLEDGRLAFLDESGNVTAVQADNKRNQQRVADGKPPVKRGEYTPYFTRYNGNGVAFMLPGGWSGEKHKLRDLPDDYSYFDNHTELLLEIAARVGDGMTLSQIERITEMPPARAILFWEGADPKFRDVMAAARRARAEKNADKVLDFADAAEEDTAKSSKIKIDAYRWAAEVGDRERFGSQTKHVGDANNPIAFIIDTGIHDAPIPAEGKTIASSDTKENIDGVPTEGLAEGNPPES